MCISLPRLQRQFQIGFDACFAVLADQRRAAAAAVIASSTSGRSSRDMTCSRHAQAERCSTIRFWTTPAASAGMVQPQRNCDDLGGEAAGTGCSSSAAELHSLRNPMSMGMQAGIEQHLHSDVLGVGPLVNDAVDAADDRRIHPQLLRQIVCRPARQTQTRFLRYDMHFFGIYICATSKR